MRRRKVVAIVAGAVAALLPVAAIQNGLTAYVERQASEEVRLAALRAVARAEWRVAQTIAALADLGKGGLQSCADLNPDAVRRAVLTTTPIKEIAVLDGAGSAPCPQLGAATPSRALSRELDTADDRAFLAAIRTRDGERALRVTWRRAADPLSLVAVVPADMFLPDASTGWAASEPTVRVMLAEGTLIAAPFGAGEGDNGDVLIARNESARYPLVATASVPRAAALAEQHDLIAAGTLGGGALIVLALALAVVLLRSRRAGAPDDLERALEAGEFIPFYQPIVDLRSGKVAGAEVLMRWRRRDGTLVPPAAFIPQAEASGLILPMTRALMEAARDEIGAALGPRPQVRIGFNLTARHFASEAVVAEVRDVFEGSPVRLSQILLEVTERQPLDDLDMARRVIAGLQALGCQVAIDDVGTGHGGLSYMLKLGVDLIKIDKMFVDALGTERYSKTIIEMLIDLARNMGMEISAEGVETFEQVAVLRRCGIYLAQGYVFAPPLPGPQFRQLIEMAHPLGSDRTSGAAAGAVGDFMAARDRVAAA
jgi:sensor c-di-GMP phosphodiesterase-like protein